MVEINYDTIFTIAASVNGMIGATVIVLPILGLGTGYLGIPLVSVSFGIATMYTSYLILLHLGHCPSYSVAVETHFNRKIPAFINSLAIFLAIVALIALYFPLMVKQVEGFAK